MSIFYKKPAPVPETAEEHSIESAVHSQKVNVTYHQLLNLTQEYMSKRYATSIYDMNSSEMVKNCIRQFIIEGNYYVEKMPLGKLVENLFAEMAEYSFLTEYLERDDIEEININAWNDVQIIPSNGVPYKTAQSFQTPEHCVSVIKRLLQNNTMAFDDSRPIAKGYLLSNVRVTAIGSSVVGKETGVACSIRLVNPRHLGKEDFLREGTCTEEMYDFLMKCFINGVSECFAGETGAGKTTVMADIMRNYPDHKRLITIENEVREFNLVRCDKNGKPQNNVIHMVTRASDDESRVIDEHDLLVASLTMNPDAICVAEMKNAEAWEAQEAARTGHAVLTTTHASSVKGIYTRLATLCLQAHSNIPYDIVYRLVCEAFPIAVYQHKMEDGVRRITDIAECVVDEKNGISINTLWRYEKETVQLSEDGKPKVIGSFKRCAELSTALQERLYANGMAKEDLIRFVGGENK